jgi:enamine deaminase RidA (YjgF/YER057c/UK114 family)
VKNTAILDKVIYHINETTAKKFIEMHVDQADALLAHFRGLLDLAGYVDLDKRKKLLRFIAYLTDSKETIEMLIVNFLQTDDTL